MQVTCALLLACCVQRCSQRLLVATYVCLAAAAAAPPARLLRLISLMKEACSLLASTLWQLYSKLCVTY
jgi:hypothetical protein